MPPKTQSPSIHSAKTLAILASALVVAGCHPALIAVAAAGGGGGGGGGGTPPVDVVSAELRTFDPWVRPSGTLNVVLDLGTGGRKRFVDVFLDPDGTAGPEAPTKLTATRQEVAAGPSTTVSVMVPTTLPVDSYRLRVTVTNDVDTMEKESDCPVLVADAGSFAPPPTTWTSNRVSTGMAGTRALALLAGGNLLTVGNFSGTLTTPTGSATSPGISALYVTSHQATDGMVLAQHFVVPATGGGSVTGMGIAVLGDDSFVVIGELRGSADFGQDGNGTPVVRQTPPGLGQVFAVRYAFQGADARVRSIQMITSSQNVRAWDVVRLPNTNDVAIAGQFEGRTQFGSQVLTARGDTDGFLARLNADGSLPWAAQIGGDDRVIDVCWAVTAEEVQGQTRIAVTGAVQDDTANGVEVRNGDNSPGTTLTTAGGSDALLAVYDDAGRLRWAVRGGGAGNDVGRAVRMAVFSGTVYAAGEFTGAATFDSNIDPTRLSIASQAAAPATNGFAMKHDQAGVIRWLAGAFSPQSAEIRGISLLGGRLEEVTVIGSFSGSVVPGLEADPAQAKLRSMGGKDIFYAHLLVGNVANPAGGRVVRLTGFGGSDDDTADALLALSPETVYVGTALRSPSLLCPPALRGFTPPTGGAGAVTLRFDVP